jgi:hypothetical protein
MVSPRIGSEGRLPSWRLFELSIWWFGNSSVMTHGTNDSTPLVAKGKRLRYSEDDF